MLNMQTNSPGSNLGEQPKTLSSGAFMRVLGYPLQFVALNPEMGKVVVRHACDNDALKNAVREMTDLNAKGWNVYYEVNPGAARRRSKAADITHLRAVVGDADAKEGRTMQDCIAATAALPLPPTFTIATGGGVHAVYFLVALTPATPENAAAYESVGRAIRDMIDGDAVFDLPRIMRMPGFTNWPDAKKQAAGRKPIKAKVLAASGRRYALAELAKAFVVPGPDTFTASFTNLNSDLSGGPMADRWFVRLPPSERNACLAEMLAVPAVAALADTSDAEPSPNWRTVLAACARSGAPGAYALCRAWAQTSPRFDPRSFDTRYRSYCHD